MADFPKTKRLLTPADFKRAFAQVRFKVHSEHLLLICADTQSPCHRLGLAVSKKHLKKAVERNRVKRVAREAFRLSSLNVPLDTPLGFDMVVVVKKRPAQLDQLSEEAKHLFVKAHARMQA